MSIEKKQYKNNLFFYTILKNLIKIKLSDLKINQLILSIEQNHGLGIDMFKSTLLSTIVSPKIKAYSDYVSFINMINEETFQIWKDLTKLSCELLLIKNLVIEEAKLYARNEYDKDISKIDDHLCFEYDSINLELPYGQRVIAALLVFATTDLKRKANFFLENSQRNIETIDDLIEKTFNKYQINANNIFMIIIDESINQSIISSAGISYEDRVRNALNKVSDNVRSRVHDANIASVEYDFVFDLAGKKYGVSAKRTLRERYKQNFEDVHQLDVDGVFVITLGIDLNQEKLTNILQRHGYFVVVAHELYEQYDYFKNNKRVISSKNFNQKYLKNYFSKLS